MCENWNLFNSSVYGGLQARMPVNAHGLFLTIPGRQYYGLRKVIRSLPHVILDLLLQLGVFWKQVCEGLMCLDFFCVHLVHRFTSTIIPGSFPGGLLSS
jgi:hypothetical protein